jgi:hypothetical protein
VLMHLPAEGNLSDTRSLLIKPGGDA